MYRAHSVGDAAVDSDQSMLARILEGDETALAELYDRYSALVFTIANRITGDRAVAEEVVQDVFFAIWRSAAGFQRGGSLAAWIIGIVRHRAIDATRARTFRARGREQSLDPLFEGSAGGMLDEQIDREVLGAQVRAAIGGLAPTQRQAIELAYYAGLSHTEIARRTGAPVGTTKTRLRLGLLHLRRELEGSHSWSA